MDSRMLWAIAEAGLLKRYRDMDTKTKHLLATACEAVAWLMTLLWRMNNSKIYTMEFCDALRLCYTII